MKNVKKGSTSLSLEYFYNLVSEPGGIFLRSDDVGVAVPENKLVKHPLPNVLNRSCLLKRSGLRLAVGDLHVWLSIDVVVPCRILVKAEKTSYTTSQQQGSMNVDQRDESRQIAIKFIIPLHRGGAATSILLCDNVMSGEDMTIR